METRARSIALSCEILLEDTKRRNQVSGRYKGRWFGRSKVKLFDEITSFRR